MDLSKLSDADLFALRAGDLSKLSDEGLMSLRGQAAPVDQSTEGLDPRDMIARRKLPMPPGNLAGIVKFGWDRSLPRDFLRGGKDLVDAGAQALSRVVPRGVSEALGMPSPEEVDRQVQQGNRDFLYSSGRTEDDIIPGRIAGNVATTMAVAPTSVPASVATRIAPLVARVPAVVARSLKGAAVGGASAASQPVFEGDFGEEKAKQAVIGAATGGVATPVVDAVARVAIPAINSTVNAVRRIGRALNPQQVDNLMAQEFERAGVRWAELGDDVREALRQDVRDAISSGGVTDPAQLRRLADLRAVGATPTRGAVTLDPVQVSAERNLAKVGANSTDPQLQRLARVENENNAALIGRMNELRGPNADDEFATGQRVISALRGTDRRAQAAVRSLYNEAEQLNSGAITLDGAAFVNQASQSLDQVRRGAFLPAQVRSIMDDIVSRQRQGIPMTLDDVEQLRTILATEARKASRAGDGNTAMAVGVVRDALEAQPTNSIRGEVANAAFNRARAGHRARMNMQEQSPALAEAIDGGQPDKFVQQYIIGGGSTVQDIAALRRAIASDPEALDSVRSQIVSYLKGKALGGLSEEGATFSQSAYNKALSAIGERKLRAFFSAQEIEQLNQVGRAARYMQVQPKGSAVNNSNTSSAIVGVLDRVLSRVPVIGEVVRQPMGSYTAARGARNALRPITYTPQDLIDEQARNSLLGLSVPIGAGLGLAASQ